MFEVKKKKKTIANDASSATFSKSSQIIMFIVPNYTLTCATLSDKGLL